MPITGTAYKPTVAPGIYQAVVTAVETRAAKADPTNEFRVWEFSLTDGSGRTVSGSSSLSTSPKSKGGKWIAALIGHPLAEGETVELVGMRCTIIVSVPDGKEYESVETVAPPDGTAKPLKARPLGELLAEVRDEDPAAHAARIHTIQEDGPQVLP